MALTRITEKYEFKTDIITAYDGHEQRIKLRQVPRHFLTFDYPSMTSYEAQWLRSIGRLKQNVPIWLVQWHTPLHLTRDVKRGAATLYIEPSCMYCLDNIMRIEVFKRDDPFLRYLDTVNFNQEVLSFGSDSFLLRKPVPSKLYKEGTFVYPVKHFSVQPTVGIEYVYANGSNVSFSFEDLLEEREVTIPRKYLEEYDDYENYNRFGLPDKLMGSEVFLMTPQWFQDSSLTLSIDKNVNRVDNEVGIFYYDLKNDKSYDIHTLELALMSRAQINNIIKFFKRVGGRYKAFYCPTWVNDINIDEDLHFDENWIYTSTGNIELWSRNNSRSRALVIFTKDLKARLYRIHRYEYEDKDGLRWTKILLSKNIGVDIPKENIIMTSFVNLVRLDSDELQINYESDTVANATLVMKEVDDGMLFWGDNSGV